MNQKWDFRSKKIREPSKLERVFIRLFFFSILSLTNRCYIIILRSVILKCHNKGSLNHIYFLKSVYISKSSKLLTKTNRHSKIEPTITEVIKHKMWSSYYKFKKNRCVHIVHTTHTQIYNEFHDRTIQLRYNPCEDVLTELSMENRVL